MSARPGESLDERRARLAADIARQRGEFAVAYRNLSKPLEYTEAAMRGFGFIRQNAWIFPAVTTTLTVGSTLLGLLGLTKGKESRLTTPERRRLAELEKARAPKGLTGTLFKWGGHGFRAFKVYRRVKKFFPS